MAKDVSYLKGLSEGLGMDAETKEGRLIIEILDVLEDLANEVEYLQNELAYALDYAEALDRDLGFVEEDLDLIFDDQDEELVDYDYDDYDWDYDEDLEDSDDEDFEDHQCDCQNEE